jgi:predicted O-methyltransferase YrrM
MDSLQKALAFLSILPQRPQEFVERVFQIIDYRFDRLFRKRPDYEVVNWESLLQDMEEYFGQVLDILDEPALGNIEEKVNQHLKNIESKAPFSLICNADRSLARGCYLACRLLKPEIVLETGVAHGVTSAYILRALEENGVGKLCSVELPPPGLRADEFVGAAIPEDLKGRWHLYYGFSKQVLPKLLGEVETVDVSVHDSCHTYRCMKREFETVWPHMRSGSMIIADDIEIHSAFNELKKRGLAFQRVVKEVDKQSLFGVAVRT